MHIVQSILVWFMQKKILFEEETTSAHSQRSSTINITTSVTLVQICCASLLCVAAIAAINWCKIVFLILFKNTHYSTRNYTHLFHVIDMSLLALSLSLYPIDTVTISVLLVLLKIYLCAAINRTNMLLTPNNDHVNWVFLSSLHFSYLTMM